MPIVGEGAVATNNVKGCKQYVFNVDGQEAWIVAPETPKPGRPWVWCLEFPYAFAERTGAYRYVADGFYYVHIVVGNTYGCPAAQGHFDAFYKFLRAKGFAPQGALVGLSRGGLYAYRFAAAHPDRVACIYGDAPVCDFKSWPAGKGKGKGSPDDWKSLVRLYGFKDEAEALAFQGNPIDSLASLARAGIPLVHVVGDADDVVPAAENTDVLAARYRALGGTITVFRKVPTPGVKDGDEIPAADGFVLKAGPGSCGHHPHGLKDPSPVVALVERYATAR